MRYQRLDLNLLIALRALLAERSVTQAAGVMHVTQPAMSGILARLREYFGDPLIIQVGRKMELTALAQELIEPINDLLVRIDTTLGTRPEFDPATSRRRFAVVASDYVVTVLLADVLRRIAREAPGMVIELRQTSSASAADLEAGEVDCIITPASLASTNHTTVNLFEDGYCMVADRSHAHVSDRIGLEQFLELEHVVLEARGKPFFDAWLERTHGEERQIRVVVETFGLLAEIVCGTPRVACVQRRLADRFAQAIGLRVVALDFEVPNLVEVLQWHRARELDSGSRWLRQVIIDGARELPALS